MSKPPRRHLRDPTRPTTHTWCQRRIIVYERGTYTPTPVRPALVIADNINYVTCAKCYECKACYLKMAEINAYNIYARAMAKGYQVNSRSFIPRGNYAAFYVLVHAGMPAPVAIRYVQTCGDTGYGDLSSLLAGADNAGVSHT